MEASDFYKVVRAQIEHVVNSRNQRIIWLVIAQSFFFSGLAILVTGNPATDGMKALQHMLMKVFPVAALLTVIFTYIDIVCSASHLRSLAKAYHSKAQEQDADYPPVLGGRHHFFESLSSHLIPILFIATWIFILTTYIPR
jgi:hypothetical protein